MSSLQHWSKWVDIIVAQYAYQSPWYAYPYHSYSRTRTRHGWQGWAERGLEGTPRSSHRPPTHYHRQHTNYIIIYLLCVEGLRAIACTVVEAEKKRMQLLQ